MPSVPMPRSLTEEAVAEWLYVNSDPFNESRVPWGGLYDGERNKWRFLARAVRALLREFGVKCRKADAICRIISRDGDVFSTHHIETHDEIVSRVLGEEAPRG